MTGKDLKNWLIAGGVGSLIAGGIILGGGEDKPEKIPVATEIAQARIGDEIKGLRTKNKEVFKGDIVKVMQKNGVEVDQQSFNARIYARQKYWIDVDGDTLKPIDLTVKDISLLASINPFKKHDQYINAGPFAASWMKNKPADYRMDANGVYVKFTVLTIDKGITVKVEPTNVGMKETITLIDETAPTTLQWQLETDGTLVADGMGGFIIRDSSNIVRMQIPPPTASDNAGTPVVVLTSVSGDTLTYQVRLSGLEKYPITIDPTTDYVDTDATTGNVASQEATYNAARAIPTSLYMSGTTIQTGQSWTGTAFNVVRAPLTFDTSALDDVALISAATVKIQMTNKYGIGSVDSTYLVAGTFTGAAVDTSWFNDFGGWASGNNAYTLTNYAPAKLPYAATNGDTLTFTLNAAGLTAINKTGNTIYMLICDRDRTNTAPVSPWDQYVIYNNDNLYMQITYMVPSFSKTPANFTLSAAATTTMRGDWTVTHSLADVDSEWIQLYSGSWTWFAKMATDTTSTYSFTGRTQATQYIYRVAVDSSGYNFYSNADTLYTLAAAPTSFALAGDDSTTFTPSWSENSNPAATTYAIRDSTLQKWVGADGIADETTAAWRTYAQWTAVKINLVTNNVNHLVGVVAKNGDGIQTTYNWIYAATGNYYWRIITASGSISIKSPPGTFPASRNHVVIDSLTTQAREIGMMNAGDQVYRLGAYFAIPNMTAIQKDSLLLAGSGDASDADFNFVMAPGTWTGAGSNTKEYYFKFTGNAASGTYSITNLLETFSTASYSTNMRIDLSAAGDAAVLAAKGDTLKVVILSSEDQLNSDPTSDEYIGLGSAPQLKIQYTLIDYVPYDISVSSIAGATDSLVVTWKDSSSTETGFALADSITGLRLGGNDSTAANIKTKRMGGFLPNSLHSLKVMVLGGKIANELSTDADVAYTRAATPKIPLATFTRALNESTHVVYNDTTGLSNPSYTRYALQDSITAYYVYKITGDDTLGASAQWYTFSGWGDSIQVHVDSIGRTRVWRFKAKSGSD